MSKFNFNANLCNCHENTTLFTPRRTKKQLSSALKQNIIQKHKNGLKICDIARRYDMPYSTVHTIVKGQSRTCVQKVAAPIAKITKTPPKRPVIAETDTAKSSHREHIKVKIVSKSPSSSDSSPKESFDRFRKHADITSGTSSSNNDAAKNFKVDFHKFVNQKGLRPQQVFNVDKIRFYWKELPRKTYLPGDKSKKDQLTLLLGGNASGDLKLKPLLVYHTETPKVFRHFQILKSNLGLLWRSDRKICVTRELFHEWLYDVFCPTVKSYLKNNNLPLRALLLLNNVQRRDIDLAANLEAEFLSVKFLPDASTIQPMKQVVIPNFKKLYLKRMLQKYIDAKEFDDSSTSDFWNEKFTVLDAVKSIVSSWSKISQHLMNSSWRPLWPEIVKDFEQFGTEDTVTEEIVRMAKSLGLEMDKKDVKDFEKVRDMELTTEEIQALLTIRRNQRDNEDEDMEDNKHVISTRDINTLLKAWHQVKEISSTNHPLIEKTELTQCHFEDEIISFFKKIQSNRQKQVTPGSSTTKYSISSSQKKARVEVPVLEVYTDEDSSNN